MQRRGEAGWRGERGAAGERDRSRDGAAETGDSVGVRIREVVQIAWDSAETEGQPGAGHFFNGILEKFVRERGEYGEHVRRRVLRVR